MYADFFGLRSHPFEHRPDPQFTYLSPPFKEALGALENDARYGQGVALIVGDAGTGKTQLLRTLLARLDSTEPSVLLTVPAGDAFALIRETCKVLRITLTSDSPARHIARLRKHVEYVSKGGRRTVLLIDQAENLTVANLRELEALSELRQVGERGMAILLAGQPRFRASLRGPEFARLTQHLRGERVLHALSFSETKSYIGHRLRAAGAATPDLIDEDSIALIQAATGGVPRLINRLCDEALVAAYRAGATRVTRELTIGIAQRHAYREHAQDREGLGHREFEARFARQPVSAPNACGDPTAGPCATGSDLIRAASHLKPKPQSSVAEDVSVGPADPVVGGTTENEGSVCSAGPAGLAYNPAFVERLETALARAEQYAATSHASLAQHAVLEKDLGALNTRAEKLISDFDDAIRRGAGSIDRLEGRIETIIESAEQRMARLDDRTIRELLDRAEAVQHGLATASSQASQHSELLDRLLDAARDLIEVQDRLAADAQTMSERLAEQLTQAQKVVGAAGTTLNDFLDKAEELQARYELLSDRAEEIESLVNDTTAGPAALVEQAGAQSKELERVCVAVRKVFANLSRSTLDAHAQSKQLSTVGEQAWQRLAALTKQTQSAAGTLQQWVQEAIRAQSRLEGALRSCPSVNETHPPDDLRKLEGAIRELPASAAITAPGGLRILDPPTAEPQPRRIAHQKTTTRAEQVSRLIEQARQAEPSR